MYCTCNQKTARLTLDFAKKIFIFFLPLSASSSDLCVTDGCVTSAGRLLESLDESIDPCDDFYGFVCGQWIDDAIIPQGSHSYSHFSK